jgi:TPR repeat protein
LKLSTGKEYPYESIDSEFSQTIGETFLKENNFIEAQKYFDLAVEELIRFSNSMERRIGYSLEDYVVRLTERHVVIIQHYLNSECRKCTDQQKAELNKLVVRYVEKGAEYSGGGQPENALKVANQYLTSGDLQKAFYWYQKSVDIAESSKTPFSSIGFYGDPYFALCYFYREGEVVKQDYSKAFRYCKKSDEIGNRAASYWLGLIYASGKGVAHNEAMAIRLLEKAHQDNYPTGGSNPYAFSLEIPSKLPTKQWLWAESVLKTLANRGDKTAQYFLGYMYLYGYGIDKDISQALFYLNASADQGVGDASLALGNFYKGEMNTRALVLFNKAAEQGASWGHYYVAKTLLDSGSCDLSEMKKRILQFDKKYTVEIVKKYKYVNAAEDVNRITKDIKVDINERELKCTPSIKLDGSTAILDLQRAGNAQP